MKSEWIISDNSLKVEDLLKNESIFNVSNGYIGIRGNFEEGYTEDYATIRGTYINAFYEEVPIQYGEKAYAFPETMEKIVNITDAQNVNIIINGEINNIKTKDQKYGHKLFHFGLFPVAH